MSDLDDLVKFYSEGEYYLHDVLRREYIAIDGKKISAELATLRAEVENLRRVLTGSTEQSIEMIYTAAESESDAATLRERVAALEKALIARCPWKNTAAPDFDGCNGCPVGCGDGHVYPGDEKQVTA